MASWNERTDYPKPGMNPRALRNGFMCAGPMWLLFCVTVAAIIMYLK